MTTFFTRTNVLRLLLLFILLGLLVIPVHAQTDAPQAFLRFEPSGSYYVAVYIKSPLAGGFDQIRASVRDVENSKLISTTVASPPTATGDDSRFAIRLGINGDEIFAGLPGYRVFVDTYPTAAGVEDHQIKVVLDVKVSLTGNIGNQGLPGCRKRTGLLIERVSNRTYGERRFNNIMSFLDGSDVERFVTATVTQAPQAPEPRNVRITRPALGAGRCVELESPPSGEYKLKVDFTASGHPELDLGTFEVEAKGPDGPDATDEKRGANDFLDLGLTLTSSVNEEEQPDKTTKRVRTSRGVMDLFLAPILNMRTVQTLGKGGGLVQVFTPFYVDSKISTGKITKDTLALNRIELGSTYEFRQYRIKAYSDLFRHALSFKHNSDRDFKQDEVKFVYEFQPIWGRLNRPRGSALNILHGDPVPDSADKFGYEIVPIIGVELGRTYRVRDPKEFEGISRNIRRFYFGGSMTFDLTRFVEFSLDDLFYVRGENAKDRTENYFSGSLEVLLGKIGNGNFRAAQALFLSFERGEQAPFTNPSVNVFKFGYRIRARGLLNR
jgi:hypothetical protein